MQKITTLLQQLDQAMKDEGVGYLKVEFVRDHVYFRKLDILGPGFKVDLACVPKGCVPRDGGAGIKQIELALWASASGESLNGCLSSLRKELAGSALIGNTAQSLLTGAKSSS